MVPAVQRARRRLRPRRAARPAPSATATSGSSTARRCGRTSAHHADFGMLLARTDWDVAQAPGHHLLRARHAPARRRGPPAAPDERPRLVQRGVPRRRPRPGRRRRRRRRRRLGGRAHDAGPRAAVRRGRRRAQLWPAAGAGPPPRTAAEVDATTATYRWYPQRAGRADLVAPRPPRRAGPVRRPCASRSSAVELRCMRTSGWTAERARAARALGRPPGAEGSLGKLAASRRRPRGGRVAHAHLAGRRRHAGPARRPGSTASSPRCWCPCRPSRSPAAPTRSSATSSASACSASPASPSSTATNPSATSLTSPPSPGRRADRLTGCGWRSARDRGRCDGSAPEPRPGPADGFWRRDRRRDATDPRQNPRGRGG